MDELLRESTPAEGAGNLMRKHGAEAIRFADAWLEEAQKSGNVARIAWAEDVRQIVRHYRRMNHLGDFMAKLGGWTMLAGAAVLGYQCYLWLRDGKWTPMPLLQSMLSIGLLRGNTLRGLGREIEGIESRGLQEIVAWTVGQVATLPASAMLFSVGMALGLIGLYYGDRRPA
jgi:hypothetical protein